MDVVARHCGKRERESRVAELDGYGYTRSHRAVQHVALQQRQPTTHSRWIGVKYDPAIIVSEKNESSSIF